MSEINVTKISSKAANTPPQIVDNGDIEVGQFCRAWVNFNGTGTVAVRDSFNVSSITDNGVGLYDVNFTNSLPNVNYSTFFGTKYNGVGSQLFCSERFTSPIRTIASLGIEIGNTVSYQDPDVCNASVFANN